MLNRRTAMMGAALAALMLAAPALAQDLNLPRQKVELVAPPFVHPHEQATKQAPKIIEFRMEIVEKEIIIDEQGTKFQAMTFNGSMPGTDDGGASGRLRRADAGQSRNQHDAAQYRLPFGDRRARRRRAHADQSRRAGRAALEGRSYRHVRLSLRAGRLDDPVARRVRHARRRDGAAARRA